MAGADLRYNLTISFAQAAAGDEIPLTLPSMWSALIAKAARGAGQ